MPEKNIDFEQSLKRLEEITNQVSKGELSLDESLALYQEGKKLIEQMQQALKDAEEKAEKIIK